MPRSCMKTRTSSYKLLRKRHNYGRRGSEPSALAHIGRALNDELDTVYARAPLREACPQQRRERKKERKNIRVRYIYIYNALPQPPTHFPRDFFSTRRTTLSPVETPPLPPPLSRPSAPTPSPFYPHSVAFPSPLRRRPAYLSARREGDETFKVRTKAPRLLSRSN